MPRRVLVPLDGSQLAESALAPARRLAHAFGATLVLVHTSFQPPPWNHREDLEALARTIEDVPVEVVVEEGFATTKLATLVAPDQGDLICMATHGHSGIGGAVLGSVADEILRRVTCPVVLVGPEQDTDRAQASLRSSPMIVCFDASPASAAIEPLVIDWAQALDLEVHVVMVLHRDGTFLGGHDSTDAKKAAVALAHRLEDAGITTRLSYLERLDPAPAIVDEARSLPADLIMTASHGASGIVRSALGSVAVRVAHHAPCPVVVLPAHRD